MLEHGGSGYQNLPDGYSSMEAEYLAVSYGLNEFILKWNRELDARQANMVDAEEAEFQDVASPAEKTRRDLPPPLLVCCDNEVVVKQLSREYHIGNARLRKLAQRIWNQVELLDVKFQWVPRGENVAGKMLK